MISSATANSFVKTSLDITTNDYVIDTTSMWFPQSMTTPFPSGKFPVKMERNDPDSERLSGVLKDQDSMGYDPLGMAVIFTKNTRYTFTINGQRKAITTPTVRTIYQKGVNYVMQIYNGVYAELFRLNWAIIEGNSTLLAQVKAGYAAFYGSSDGDNEAANLINYMATSELVLKYKPFTLSTDEIEVQYVIAGSENGVTVGIGVDVNGVRISPERIFTQMYPVRPMVGLPNTAQNRGSGAAFSQRQSFELCSDLNVRGVEHVMAGGVFNFKTVVTVKDSNGNDVFKEHNQAIDLTNDLPAYNYFNL